MDFKIIDSKYRPMPFWSWNEKLDVEETKRQIKLMHEAGLGGFFMHARGGLKTEYMGKEWFDNISAGIDTAKKLGMYPWAYDENGWPSGFGDGKVNGLGKKYQQKWLRYDNLPDGENTICHIDGVRYYYEINPFYVDVLLYDATKVFIEEIYTPYYEKYKNEITGFFTDEPQISRDGIPWSETLPVEYKKAYGDDLTKHLAELFENKGDYKTTRIRFYKLITDLFSKNYMKQIYDWCTERGLALTGHLVQEETFEIQTTSSGAVMPHYEYFTIPGMDCLGRNIIYDLTSYQLGSAAQQLGKKQVLSESFAGCGHNVTFCEMKKIYEHQMVHGMNLLCQHLEGYSLRGIRKRDWPPALFYQQPWWEKYKIFCDAMARTGMILAEGEPCVDTLLIHPMTTAWTFYNENGNEGLEEFYQSFKTLVNDFDKKHIQFHLGDETIIERHGRVDGTNFVVGNISYEKIVLPDNLILLDNTKKLLDEYVKNGGIILRPEEIVADNKIVDNENIIYTKRVYKDFDIYYFVNHTDDEQTANILVSGKRIDAVSGDTEPFSDTCKFAPGESVILMCDGKIHQTKTTERKILDLDVEWKIENSTLNILTLDFCDYWFDGVLQEQNGYVLNITNRAIELKKPVKIRQVYNINIKNIPDELYFVCETPEKFDICINGTKIDSSKNNGTIIDSSFKKLDIASLVKKGANQIELLCDFVQSDKVYKDYEDASVFETMKNKLTYDMEIEPCYLAGDFGVETGATSDLSDGTSRVKGPFAITKKPEKICLKDIQKQGFPFFAGTMTLSKEI
ncbi:MAG: hypothetical protein II978_01100, partial [Clostridia bacterium]|nr:hypothetical protein [Clostridia bacterium]